MRHAVAPEKIIRLDSKELYALGVQIRMFDSENLRDNTIESIIVNGNSAKAILTDTVKNVQLPIHFSKENDKWKINFTPFYAKYGEAIWHFIFKESGKAEAETFTYLLEYLNGKKPKNSIWHPLVTG